MDSLTAAIKQQPANKPGARVLAFRPTRRLTLPGIHRRRRADRWVAA